MKAQELVKTIYLGDRGVKGIVIDLWNSEVKFQIDLISRVRGGTWDFYSDEDIEDGEIIITEVYELNILPKAYFPTDYIIDFWVEQSENGIKFAIKSGCIDNNGAYVEMTTSVSGKGMCLYNPVTKERIFD